MVEDQLHEVTAVSDHTRCYSKSIYDIFDVGCTCKCDTVETRVVGTEQYRNWQFPKGHCPLVVGQQITLEELKIARTGGVIAAAEEFENSRKKTPTALPPAGPVPVDEKGA